MQRIILILGVLLALAGTGWADGREHNQLAPALARAMIALEVSPSSDQLLVVSNAPYLRGRQPLKFVNTIETVTGARVGKGNLLFLWRDKDYPLLTLLFNKANNRAEIIKQEGAVFQTEALVLDWEAVKKRDFWLEAIEYEASRDFSALIPMVYGWAMGVPYDYLKLAELHGDLCPGVSAGYLMARYLEQYHPLAAGERYIFVASPAYCKDDAFQQLFGSTVGRKRLVASVLSPAARQQLTVENPAGLVIVWSPSEKQGKGLVLSFNFEAVRQQIPKGNDRSKPTMTMAMFDNFSTPESLVKVAAEFKVDAALYGQLLATGADPYGLLGLRKSAAVPPPQ